MKKFVFKKIDAFATQTSAGNPAGYIHLQSKHDIDPETMQQIAKELKGFVNEVGYIYQTYEQEFNLKYYSAEREVDFCGHATIAILYDLIKKDSTLRSFDHLYIRTNKGKLVVENRIESEDAVFIMSPPSEEIKHSLTAREICEALNIEEPVLNKKLPIKIINAGLNTLIVPIGSLEEILPIFPDLKILGQFCIQHGIDIIEVFTDEVSGSDSDYRTRVFAPTFGYLEDPATGSGNSALGYYLIEEGLWQKQILKIEQNSSLHHYNIVKLQRKKDANGNERVLFGGGAITRMEGEYILQ